jgi:cyclopropane fatty-acyl-phospholipid synthase-like methyltransferase
MSSELSAQYERQERWRHWDEALTRIALQAGQQILDLGCGVGEVAGRFYRRGAQGIGVDRNEELLKAAAGSRWGIEPKHSPVAEVIQ